MEGGSTDPRVAAHDIANALTSVLGWIHLAQGGHVSSEEALKSIALAAKIARRTAQGLLGGEEDRVATEIENTLRDIASVLRPMAQARGGRIDVQASPGLHLEVRPNALFRTVWNLALNAVQHIQPGGTVRLRSDVVPTSAFITVEDDGPGIAPDVQQAVLRGGVSSRKQGHGIGLSSARTMMEEMGGYLMLDSIPGFGTRIRLDFPITQAEVRPPRRRSQRYSSQIVRRDPRLVLLVEDNNDVRELMTTTLELHGMSVVSCATAQSALSQNRYFDIAIVDQCLPDADGSDLIHALRARSQIGQVIVASGLPPAEDLEVSAWLRKPFDPEELVQLVASQAAIEVG